VLKKSGRVDVIVYRQYCQNTHTHTHKARSVPLQNYTVLPFFLDFLLSNMNRVNYGAGVKRPIVPAVYSIDYVS
jgi:hypothetical protein